MTLVNVGIGFSSREHAELTNSYKDLVSLSLAAPSVGFVMLTGSGYFKLLNKGKGGWATISIGRNSGSANKENETSLQIPSESPPGDYNLPFCITAVLRVDPGHHDFYMVGIKDPNPAACYANGLNLSALFVRSLL